MSSLYGITAVLTLTILAVVSQSRSQSSDNTTTSPIVNTTVVENDTVAVLNHTNNTSNSSSSGNSPSGWTLLLRKFFDRPSSHQKHADKNRIILENLAASHLNSADTPKHSAVAFHDEETVAVITYADRNVESCKLMEVK